MEMENIEELSYEDDAEPEALPTSPDPALTQPERPHSDDDDDDDDEGDYIEKWLDVGGP